ncbi:MAG: cysteine rich repeat-containing protein [Beijerinckiaceae bacterium]
MSKLLFVALIFIGAAPALAQDKPTFSEQLACRSDAQQYCAEHVGKPPEMFACLKTSKAKLSDTCRKVVEAHGG